MSTVILARPTMRSRRSFSQAARLMVQSGYCGAYLGVVEPGTLCAGDPVVLEPGPREVNLRELSQLAQREQFSEGRALAALYLVRDLLIQRGAFTA